KDEPVPDHRQVVASLKAGTRDMTRQAETRGPALNRKVPPMPRLTATTQVHLVGRDDVTVSVSPSVGESVGFNISGGKSSLPELTLFMDVAALEALVEGIAEAFQVLDAEAVQVAEVKPLPPTGWIGGVL